MPTQKTQIRQRSLCLVLVAGCAALFSPNNTALGAAGTWNSNSSGNWSDTAKWTSGIVADGATFTAALTGANLTGSNKTVTLDTSRIIGRLNIGDNNTSDRRSYILAASGGSTLTFDNGGSASTLQQIANSNGDTISAPIILNNNLTITNSSGSQRLTISTGGITAGNAGEKTITIGSTTGGDVTISGVIGDGAGSIAIVKGNANNDLTLSGANTFTGNVKLNAGLLLLNNATALGSTTGTLIITGGSIGGNTTMSTNNVQNWNGDFGFGGTASLNLGTGAVTMSASRTITIGSSNDTLTVGGIISGAGFSLSTANSTGVATGILALTGANTYDGGTNINGGVVRFGSGAIPATGMITIQTGGALSVSGAHTTLAGWLANTALSNTATGALSLAGDSSESFDPGAAGFNTVSLGANVGATANYTGTLTPSGSGYFVGGGGGTINFLNAGAFTGASALTVGNGGGGAVVVAENNATYSGNVTIANGTLQLGAGGTTGSLGTPTSFTNNGKLVFNRSDDLSFGSNITGTGQLIKQGANTLTLSGTSTYTGETQILGGTIAIGANDALPTTTSVNFGNNTASTGNLDLAAFNQTLGSLNVSSNNTTANVINIPTGKTLTVNGNVIIGNTVTDLALTGLNTTGGGSLVISGAAITFEIGRNIGTTNNSARSLVDFSSLGNFTANLGTGSLVIQPNGDNTNTQQSSLTLSNTANTITAATITVGGSGTGAQPLLKLGSGTNTFNINTINIGTGTRDGGLVNFATAAGTLKIRGSGGTDSDLATLNIGTGSANTGLGAVMSFDVSGHSADLKFAAVNIGTQPRATNYSAAMKFDQGTLDMSSLTLATRGDGGSATNGATAGRTTTGTLDIGGGTVNIANGILKLGEVTSSVGNVGTFFNTADGTVNISGGTVTIGNTAGTAISLGSAIVTTFASGTLNFTGGTTTINGNIVRGGGAGTTAGTFNIAGGSVNMSSSAIGDSTNPITIIAASGTLSNVAAINGTGGLTKSTAGLLTLGGASTYAGATNVDAGTLRVNGSITSAVTVLAGTLDGTGNGITTGLIGAPVVIGDSTGTGDAILAPGNSIGTLTATGALTFNSDALFAVELNSNLSLTDLMVANGVTINPLASISFADLGSSTFAPGSYTLINNTSAAPISGVFSNLADGTSFLIGANNFVASYSGGTGNDLVLNVAAIPEPSTLVLGGLALLGFAGAGLRKRRLTTQTV